MLILAKAPSSINISSNALTLCYKRISWFISRFNFEINYIKLYLYTTYQFLHNIHKSILKINRNNFFLHYYIINIFFSLM